MIVGNDISHYNGQVDFSVYKNNSNFLIAKASDGAYDIDSMYGYNRQQARLAGLPFGSYHFAEGADVNAEAQRFCSVIDGDPIREGEILCLDYEIALKDPVSWCKIWLDVVSGHFGGIKPFIYLNQALVKAYDWSPIIDAGYPLWLASYTGSPLDNSGDKGKWPAMVFQQWTSTQHVPGIGDGKTANVDGDVFLGDTNMFKNWGYKKPQPIPTTPPVVAPPTPPNQPETPPVTPPTTQPSTPPVTPQPTPSAPSDSDKIIAAIRSVIYAKWTWLGANGWRNRLASLWSLLPTK